MTNYKTAKAIRALLIIVIVVFVVALGVSIFYTMFYKGSTAQVDTSKESLLNSSVDHSVKMTVRGSIIADEDFRSYQILVTPNSRTFTTYKGYQDQIISTTNLDNNVPAYEEFVHALDIAKLADGTELTGDSNNTQGVCATGKLYQFEIIKSGKTIKKLWTTSCSSAKGSLSSNLETISSLFIQQIPDARTAIRNLW